MTNVPPEFELVEPDDHVYADYSNRFVAYNIEQCGWEIETYSFVFRAKDKIVAGGRGQVYLGLLEVRGLWVDDVYRGRGIGVALLNRIEEEARRRRAIKAWLYTYSWQAESFYHAQGYEEFARLDFPHGHCRIDMQKLL